MYSFLQFIEELPELLAAKLYTVGSGKEQKVVVSSDCSIKKACAKTFSGKQSCCLINKY